MTEEEREKNRVKVAKYRARKKARELGLEVPEEYAYIRPEYQDEYTSEQDNQDEDGDEPGLASMLGQILFGGAILAIGIIKGLQEVQAGNKQA